jgi:peptide-methionine (S)-S-oxide reductase
LTLASFLTLTIVKKNIVMNDYNLEKATFGSGCFWCSEAVFQDLRGVKSIIPGYAGGHVENPSYREVCSGRTGHAEVSQLTFDPSVIAYDELLTVFWHTHNPTTKNRQGNDIGTQYRSVIFYHNAEQREIAEQSRRKTNNSNLWQDEIVTEIEPLENFYKAGEDHQNYYKNHPNAAYCSVVIAPKIKKLKENFPHLLKESEKV